LAYLFSDPRILESAAAGNEEGVKGVRGNILQGQVDRNFRASFSSPYDLPRLRADMDQFVALAFNKRCGLGVLHVHKTIRQKHGNFSHSFLPLRLRPVAAG
jgi:hypothetical protein